jgi:hypothetical protein
VNKAIYHGGPAFPVERQAVAEQYGHMGMTLRDYFAAKALPVAWHAYDQGYTGDPECVELSIAHHAYQIADAMLKARDA